MSSDPSKRPLTEAEKIANHWSDLRQKSQPQRLAEPPEQFPKNTIHATQQKEERDWYEDMANRKLYSGLVFTCQIGGLPPETFQVTQFDLHEGLSELFTLTIQAVSALPEIDFSTIRGCASSITIMREGIVTRCIQGILASVEQKTTDGVKTWYQFVMRPEMWIMTLKQDSRIFQDTKVPVVLKTLLKESHIMHDSLLYHPEEHLERAYITQKRETMYDFWCRLAAEAASEPAIFAMLDELDPPASCLYSEPIQPEIIELAPYLVEVNDEVRKWLSQRETPWDIYVYTQATMRELRQHLRKYLMAMIPDQEKPVFWRYYDPRIVWRMLYSFDNWRLHTFLGPITKVETELWDEHTEANFKYQRQGYPETVKKSGKLMKQTPSEYAAMNDSFVYQFIRKLNYFFLEAKY